MLRSTSTPPQRGWESPLKAISKLKNHHHHHRHAGSDLRERERRMGVHWWCWWHQTCSGNREDPYMVVLLMSVAKLMGFAVAKVQLERENSERELREKSLREGERRERMNQSNGVWSIRDQYLFWWPNWWVLKCLGPNWYYFKSQGRFMKFIYFLLLKNYTQTWV